MTAPSSIDPTRFLHEQLGSASPDLLRQMLTTFMTPRPPLARLLRVNEFSRKERPRRWRARAPRSGAGGKPAWSTGSPPPDVHPSRKRVQRPLRTGRPPLPRAPARCHARAGHS